MTAKLVDRKENLILLSSPLPRDQTMSSLTARKGLLLKADIIAAAFQDEVKASLEKCSRPPKLVGILATTSAPSKSYAEFTRKQCEALGVDFVLKTVGAAASPELGEGEGVEEAIIEANEDPSIHGIMVCRLNFPIINSSLHSAIIIKGLLPNIWTTAGRLNPVALHLSKLMTCWL